MNRARHGQVIYDGLGNPIGAIPAIIAAAAPLLLPLAKKIIPKVIGAATKMAPRLPIAPAPAFAPAPAPPAPTPVPATPAPEPMPAPAPVPAPMPAPVMPMPVPLPVPRPMFLPMPPYGRPWFAPPFGPYPMFPMARRRRRVRRVVVRRAS